MESQSNLVDIDLDGYALLFDLDGTLVDSAPDLISTLNKIMRDLSLAPVEEKIARPIISLGARNMLKVGLEANGQDAGDQQLDELLGHFLAHYEAHIADYSQVFEQAEVVLTGLQTSGAKLAVCTNKGQKLAELLLQKLGLDRHFEAVAGRDRFHCCKPHPDHLTETAKLVGIHDKIIMIGDSSTDIDTARAAGVPVIAASFGYETQPIETLSPDRIFHHYDELPGAIGQIVN